MSRFVMEHLPRAQATYHVTPVDFAEAKLWLHQPGLHSLIRTTELMAAIDASMGTRLVQHDLSASLRPGDEALLLSLSFGVLLAFAEGDIPPLPEDWRCALLVVGDGADEPLSALVADVSEEEDDAMPEEAA